MLPHVSPRLPAPRADSLAFAKYDRLIALCCCPVVLVPTNREVQFLVSAAKRLLAKILVEVVWVSKKVAMDID